MLMDIFRTGRGWPGAFRPIMFLDLQTKFTSPNLIVVFLGYDAEAPAGCTFFPLDIHDPNIAIFFFIHPSPFNGNLSPLPGEWLQ